MGKQSIDPLGTAPGGSNLPKQTVSAIAASTTMADPRELGPDAPQTSADVAQTGNMPAAEANALHASLQYELAQAHDENRNLQAELVEARAEVARVTAEHEALKHDRAQRDSGEFDPTRPHLVVDTFRHADVSGTVAYEAGTKIEDPFVLRRLHKFGAKLAPIPK